MAVAISAGAPPSLHGRRSRLSRSSSAAAVSPLPLFGAGDDDAARTPPPFAQGGFMALLMRGRCELLSFSDDDLPPPRREQGLLPPAHMFCSQQQLRSPAPPLSLVDALSAAPVSEDDVDVLAPMFSQEEIQSLWAAHHHAPPPRLARSRSAGEKRRSPASPPWPSFMSDDDGDSEAGSPPPPRVIKRARTKVAAQQQKPSRPRLNWLRRRLREWHGEIAARILRRQFSPPEPSRGRTALGCQCHELALAASGGGESCCCALHQEAREPEDRAWMYSAQGRMPLVGGPGEVLVPTMAAGNSKATVLQYARWRRGVRMPSRFYLEHAAQQQQQQQGMMAPAAGRWPEEDWMMID
ncbi:unnamed protein product [Urochloa decumbens]|uniref:Uncharacterized protein n=1 Tax=Urochloa decumbens TaxID=240449 RepID=A0ABC9BES1_9POAL